MNRADFVKKSAEYEKIVLPNGLTVLICEMPEYSSVHAVYATKFGSIDREYVIDGEHIKFPAGIAHFLEHKMFENQSGDAFELFAHVGANANAYTSFDKTCYIFTATENIDESLDILLNFVSKPYFTEVTVKKEQGIIGQEINMYLDNVEWRLMFALYESLYQYHFVRDDIAGSLESISEITPEMLYKCTDAFYRPENMVLSVAGKITRAQVINACERAILKSKSIDVKKVTQQESSQVNQKLKKFNMDISKPMLGIGFKEKPMMQPCAKFEIICDMITELIAGSMTPLYRKLYDEALVSAGFSGEFTSLDGALTIVFSAETSEPEIVRNLILEEIDRIRKNGVDEVLFTLCKNSMYGDLISDLESVDDFASGMMSTFCKNRTLYEEIEALACIGKIDVDEALQSLCLEENSATVIIYPIEKE